MMLSGRRAVAGRMIGRVLLRGWQSRTGAVWPESCYVVRVRACVQIDGKWLWPARIPCNAVFEVMMYQMAVHAHRQGAAELESGSGLPAVIST